MQADPSISVGVLQLVSKTPSWTCPRWCPFAVVCRESRLGYTICLGDSVIGSAVVCRESRLGYTADAVVQVNPDAVVCRESRLGYTIVLWRNWSRRAVVCRESRLGYTRSCISVVWALTWNETHVQKSVSCSGFGSGTPRFLPWNTSILPNCLSVTASKRT